jgi:hypothetical protein
MYLIIIPGLQEPCLAERDHYLFPLMDDMLISWERGHHFSQMPSCSKDCTSRCAIAAIVCDLPAACKVAQLAGHSSHFLCSIFQGWHTSSHGRTDSENWKPHDHHAMQRHAEAWKNAPTLAEQTKLFGTHGVCWSELWPLPYWDPVRQLVVDLMHCILEGLAQYQACDILRLSMVSALAKPPVVAVFAYQFMQPNAATKASMTVKEVNQIGEIHTLLTASIPVGDDIDNDSSNMTPLEGKLKNKNLQTLRFVALSLSC